MCCRHAVLWSPRVDLEVMCFASHLTCSGCYCRINAENSGQFERTLIVAEDDAYVSYLEGCTAPSYDKNQVTHQAHHSETL